jgi:hypothetical protein
MIEPPSSVGYRRQDGRKRRKKRKRIRKNRNIMWKQDRRFETKTEGS